MLRRKAYARLLEWKNQERKKALCIIGARQIGKTTLVREFGRENYEHSVKKCLCRNFILPEICKPGLFLSVFQFAKLIVPYL